MSSLEDSLLISEFSLSPFDGKKAGLELVKNYFYPSIHPC